MPRKILARRFEPRYGVTQEMLDTEVKWVGRELEDYLLLSINDLREKLQERKTNFAAVEEHLTNALSSLPDRERLALKCMLARDVFHVAKLYELFLRTSPVGQETSGHTTAMPEEVNADGGPQPVLVFRQSLFEP